MTLPTQDPGMTPKTSDDFSTARWSCGYLDCSHLPNGFVMLSSWVPRLGTLGGHWRFSSVENVAVFGPTALPAKAATLSDLLNSPSAPTSGAPSK
jgi:hypothetical protein